MTQTRICTFLLVSTLSLCACSSDVGPTQPTASETPSANPGPTTETPWTDPETTAAPPPPPSSLPPEPGPGTAELAIMVKPSDSEPAIQYTLTCKNGSPTDESQHPYPAKACEVLKTILKFSSPNLGAKTWFAPSNTADHRQPT